MWSSFVFMALQRYLIVTQNQMIWIQVHKNVIRTSLNNTIPKMISQVTRPQVDEKPICTLSSFSGKTAAPFRVEVCNFVKVS